MIRKLSINMLDYAIDVVLPPHKRQAKRTSFLKGLVFPLQQDSEAYNDWVNESIIKAQVTGQTGSLQWYLNYRFDADLKRIQIVHGTLTGIPLSKSTESGSKFRLSLVSENGFKQRLKLTGENISSIPKDFRVIIPNTVDVGQLKKVVDTYRQRGKLYDVQTI